MEQREIIKLAAAKVIRNEIKKESGALLGLAALPLLYLAFKHSLPALIPGPNIGNITQEGFLEKIIPKEFLGRLWGGIKTGVGDLVGS